MSADREKILVVESDPDICELIEDQTLKPQGYIIKMVNEASSAIHEAVNFSPDVVIANLDLPGLSGKDLLVALTSQGLDIPTIMVAHEGMETDVIQAFRLGASDYLTWPFKEAELLSVVERALKQVRTRRERQELSEQLKITNEQLQSRVKELTTMYSVGKAVTSITDQAALFKTIVEGAVQVTNADSGWLLIRDDRDQGFILSACQNVPNSIRSQLQQSWDDGISSLVALSGEILNIHGEPLKRFKISKLGKAVVVVPVKVKNEVIGLMVAVRKAPHPFNSSEQNLLGAVADYASISLMNAELFKALDERARSLQEAVENAKVSERMMNEFIQNVGGKLDAPLGISRGYIDQLINGQFGRINEKQLDALKTIQDKVERTIETVDMLVKLLHDATPKHRTTVNLNDIALDSLEHYQPIAQQNSVAIVTELSSKPVYAIADSAQISHVLGGLLSNAIRYNSEGGRVIIRVEEDEKAAHISVEDTGLGIHKNHLEHIFDRGYRKDSASNQRSGGLGIGLALIKDIITSHGGNVWVDSTQGAGSTFHFTLPTLES